MAKKISENLPDSHVKYNNQSVANIRGYAKTKFGSSVIECLVDRDKKCFLVLVKDGIEKIAKEEFEQMWTMCKVLTVIS